MKYYYYYYYCAISLLLFINSCTSLSVLNRMEFSQSTKDDFVWGINGHPIWSYDYENAPLEQQISLLKEHQFDYYRIDINTDTSGNIKPSRLERFEKLMKLSVSNNLKILPILRVYEHLENVNFEVSPDQAYQMGFRQAKGFVEKYGHHFEYYELGNEMDIKTIKEKNMRGFEISDYKPEELELIATYLKGMITAIKENNPEAKIMINISGWLRWGFLDYMVGKNVQFDILSYHWYSENGLDMFDINNPQYDIYSTLVSKFRKPIWITEINKYNGSKYHTEKQQAEMMDLYIRNLKHKPYIEGFFVYELYDQPYHATQKWVDYEASVYGIVGWKSNPPVYSEYYYKPVSDVLKYRIEEAKSGYEDFIYAALYDLYEEEPSETEIKSWSSHLKSIKSKELVIKEIIGSKSVLIDSVMSQDEPDPVHSLYRKLLKRDPDAHEIKYWNKKLKKKLTPRDLLIKILLSEEYWENAIWNGYEKRTGFKRPK